MAPLIYGPRSATEKVDRPPGTQQVLRLHSFRGKFHGHKTPCKWLDDTTREPRSYRDTRSARVAGEGTWPHDIRSHQLQRRRPPRRPEPTTDRTADPG